MPLISVGQAVANEPFRQGSKKLDKIVLIAPENQSVEILKLPPIQPSSGFVRFVALLKAAQNREIRRNNQRSQPAGIRMKAPV